MSRISRIAVVVTVLAFCLGTAASQSTGPKSERGNAADLGFDYRTVIKEHQSLLNAGEAEKAVDFIFAKGKQGKTGNQAFAEDLKKKFSGIYGNCGKHDGYEISGYKQISPRCYIIYAIGHYETMLVQFGYGFERWNGEWKLQAFSMSDNMEDMATRVAFERVTAK